MEALVKSLEAMEPGPETDKYIEALNVFIQGIRQKKESPRKESLENHCC